MSSIVNKAWNLYCEETVGDMDVRDSWEELPPSVQIHYLTLAGDAAQLKHALTREQHLFACLMEEAAEVSQQIGKIFRFGLDDKHPALDENNKQRLISEIKDFQAILEMLMNENSLPYDVMIGSVTKQAKTESYIEYAKQKGTVHA